MSPSRHPTDAVSSHGFRISGRQKSPLPTNPRPHAHDKKIATRVQDALFGSIHGQSLVYNTCWEDPRLDRRLLGLGPDSRVVVITSAGDNALDYLLDGPARVDCVDVNFRQNALLELKRALFAHATFEELYAFFGEGGGPACAGIYARIRHTLPAYAAAFWDRHIGYFRAGRLSRSFYYHGASGLAAFVFSRLISALKPGLRRNIPRLLEAGSPEEQRRVFAAIEPVFWDRLSRWLVGRPETMALLGVPRPQIDLIRHSHPGGLEGFVRDKVRHVFTGPPMAENYFWRVYLTGRYTRRCCPEYLKESRFAAIRDRLPLLAAHTDTLTGFLAKNPGPYTHFVLLDHQDWLASHAPAALAEEWDRILSCAAPGTKILMRTAGLDVAFVPQAARSRLRFFPELTEPLHAADRVGTYGSQHLAVVA